MTAGDMETRGGIEVSLGEVKSHSGSKTAYIVVAGSRDHVDELLAVLAENGVGEEPLHLFDGRSIQGAMDEAIERSDVVVALFDTGRPHPTAAFEIGLAVGRRKPVLLVVPYGVAVPVGLESLFQIRFSEDSLRAIAKPLRLFLDRMDATLAKVEQNERAVGPTVDLTDLRKEATNTADEATAHRLLADALRRSGVDVAVEDLADSTMHLDIVVWDDALGPDLNPVVFEVKSGFVAGRLEEQVDQLARYLKATGAMVGFLVAAGRLAETKAAPSRMTQWGAVLIVKSLSEILEELQTHSLAEIVTAERNAVLHGGR